MFLSCPVFDRESYSVLRKLYAQGAGGATHRRSAPWVVLVSSSFLEAAAGQRRSRRRSGYMHKTRTEPGYMAGTNAGAIRGVHCRPQACQSFEAVRWSSSCRLGPNAGSSPSWWRVGCCGGLPPPGKGPSPAVWGEGLSRLPLSAGSVSGATSGVVYTPAPTALPAASKAQPRRPSLRPKAPSLRRLLRPLLF